MTYEASIDLNRLLQGYDKASVKLSHAINQMTSKQQWALLTTELLQNILENTSLPTPQEQLNNFIVWLGKKQPSLGCIVDITGAAIAASGVSDGDSLAFLLKHAQAKGLFEARFAAPELVKAGIKIATGQLTFEGWNYFYELQRGRSASRQAFMAMKFGDEQLDSIYRDHFKAAVGATGFTLKRLDEGQQAGLIDDHLRVEIRQSRFLIADLTHHNKGAYWEAGFAEGLGKPVIYTCRKDAFENGEVHFDANHHLTVIWEPENLGDAVEKLKATIRATLPDEANLED